MNLLVTRDPWQLPDLVNRMYAAANHRNRRRGTITWYRIPSFLRHRAQSTNLGIWTRKLPLLHSTLPAEIAASIIESAVADLGALAEALIESESSGRVSARSRSARLKTTVVSINSKDGTPLRKIEALVNLEQDAPTPFKITDPSPDEYLDAWIARSAHSEYLQFLPQAVDISTAAPPPPSIVSRTSALYDPSHSDVGSDSLKLYIWLSSFHRYKRQSAINAMRHTLQASDAFVIFSLTDRRLLTLLSLLPHFFYLWMTMFIFYPTHILCLIFTYPLPIVPAIAIWNDLLALLKARTFDETMEIVDAAMGFNPVAERGQGKRRKGWFDETFKDERRFAEREGWVFESGIARYRWPLGCVSYVVGRRKDLRKRSGVAEPF